MASALREATQITINRRARGRESHFLVILALLCKSNCSGIPKVFYVGGTAQPTGRDVVVGGEE